MKVFSTHYAMSKLSAKEFDEYSNEPAPSKEGLFSDDDEKMMAAERFWKQFVYRAELGQIGLLMEGEELKKTQALIGSPEKRKEFEELTGHNEQDFTDVLKKYVDEAEEDRKSLYKDGMDRFQTFLQTGARRRRRQTRKLRRRTSKKSRRSKNVR